MFGSGVGTNGAGGPGILQILGIVAVAIALFPLVTGVFGGFTATVVILFYTIFLTNINYCQNVPAAFTCIALMSLLPWKQGCRIPTLVELHMIEWWFVWGHLHFFI